MCLQKKQLKQTTNQSQIQAHLLVIRPGLAATRTNEVRKQIPRAFRYSL